MSAISTQVDGRMDVQRKKKTPVARSNAIPLWVSWKPPPQQWVKVNFDGSMGENGNAAAACLGK